jgi:hypothetical protein
MTLSEFDQERHVRPCGRCHATGLITQHNANNNGLLVYCPNCGSKTPWGSLLYLKRSERKRPTRPPLPDGETLDSIWEKFGNRCLICSAPKSVLAVLGIGRQVHHVAPYAEEGHKGPLIPICTHCHPVVTDRQRIYWFIRRRVMNESDASQSDERQHSDSEETEEHHNQD